MQRITVFKRIASRALGTALSTVALVSMIAGQTQAATSASFDQTSWTGGATANVATEAIDRSGWTQYAESTAQTATTITLAIATTTMAQTSDATTVGGFNYASSAFATTTTSGAGTSTSVVLTRQMTSFDTVTTDNTSNVTNSAAAGGWGYGTFSNTLQNGQTGSDASVILSSSSATQAINYPRGNLYAIQFLDANTGHAVGAGGVIRRTADGGATWSTVASPTTLTLRGLQFVNATTGYAIGGDVYDVWNGASNCGEYEDEYCYDKHENNIVLKTTDGGVTWNTAYAGGQRPGTSEFRAGYFTDVNTGYIVSRTKSFKTTDGGTTWTPLSLTSTTDFNAILFTDANTGYVVGASGLMRKTTDGGATWAALNSGTTVALNDIYFTDVNTGYVVGELLRRMKTTDGGATWASVQGSNALHTVYFTDANTGYATGQNGTFLRTSDAGTTWSSSGGLFAGTPFLRDMHFASATTGYAVGDGGVIYKTVDAGITWKSLNPNTHISYAVAMVSPTTAYAVGEKGSIWKSTDSGANWTPKNSGVVFDLKSVFFTDANTGYAAGSPSGNNTIVIKTSDGGESWSSVTVITGGNNFFASLYFTDANTGYAAGGLGLLYKTVDAGATWSPLTSGTTQTLNAIRFTSATTGYVVGNAGTIRKTTDAGATWTALNLGGTTSLYDMYFTDANTGYAVGSGVSKKTTDGGTTWTSLSLSVAPNYFKVHFTDANTGYVVGASGSSSYIAKTTDAGATWAELGDRITGGGLRGINFFDATGGVAVGYRLMTRIVNAVTYTPSGTYTSYVDGGSTAATWNRFAWDGTFPSGQTTIGFKVKGTATAVAPSFASGTCAASAASTDGFITLDSSCVPEGSRYLWYQATLNASSDRLSAPALDSVTGTYVSMQNYYPSGTFTSGVLSAAGPAANWGTLAWTQSGGQTVEMRVRTGASPEEVAAADWGAATTESGTSLASLGAVAGHQFIQYQATLSTANPAQSPSLDDVTLTYAQYVPLGAVTSSIYDTTSAYNTMTGLTWKEDTTLPSGTSVTIALRTGASTSTLGAWVPFTNASTGCAKVGDTVTCTSSAIPSDMRDGSGDRYFQYKVDLTSNGQYSPTVSQVKPSYNYNVAPSIATLSATQIVVSSDANFGKVRFDFALRDTDSTTNQASATFEYSTDGGTNWSALSSNIATYNASNGSVSNPLTIATSGDTAYYGIWDVSSAMPNAYSTTVKVRVTANDGDQYNSTTTSTSANFTVDTQAPIIASFAPASTYATSTTVSLNLSASDASGIDSILLSNDGSAYTSTSYATAKTWTVPEGDGTKTMYLKVVDNVGNVTTATSTTVTLDTTNPTGSISVPTYSTSTAQLTLSATDTNNVAQMQFANDGGAYSAFETYATTKVWPLSVGDGVKTVSVKFKDNAGNISSAYTATTTVDSTAPTGSISINTGASIATSTSVILDLSATDALSGVNQMQFSANGTDWDSAEAYATTKAYVLAAGDGTKTVYVRFIDNAGNVSTSTSDTILLDTSIPTLVSDSVLINGNATTNQSETPNVTLSLQNVAGQPTGETVYVQFSRNGSDWYGANANGTVTADAWGTGFASDEATITSLSWPWTLQSKSETITARIKDGVVDGVSTDSNQGTYNIAPIVSSVTASQQPDASVRVEYALRDTDNGTVTVGLEYSVDGVNWTTLGAAITGQQGSLSVNGSDATFVATWDAKTTLAGIYDDSVYIRVAADDGELLNNTGSATSSAFAVDAKAPTLTALLIDGSATSIEAETPNVTLAIDGLQGYPTGEEVSAQFSRDGGTTWYGYVNGTSTQDVWGDAFTASPEFAWTLAGRSETISVRLKDSFGNLSTTASNQAAYNIRPEVAITGASQATSTGAVTVSFDVRDADTFTNSVTPTYQYSINGSTWNAIDPQQLSVTDANGVAVTDLAVSGAYATYTATWDAKTQFPNAVTNVFFKVSVDDAQPIKNIGAATSSAIVVDAKAPTLAADSFLINDSAEIAIASSRDITFKLQNVTGNPTDEIIQARFSRDNGATWSAWSVSFATDATTLGATTFPWTMAGRSETLRVSVRDIFGNESETTDENGAGYNLRPQIVSGPSAAQVTDPQNVNYGKVAIGYTVKDEDTAEGSTPGQITPAISYSIDGGVNWNEIASSSASLVLTSDTDGMQPVAASDTILSATWDVKADLGATYNQNLQIKLTVNDNEGIFNLATATSSIFAIDTTDPVIVSATYNGVTQRLAFHFTDEAAFQYRVSASPLTATTSATTTQNANDGAWQDATASVNMTREWIVTATSTAPTVYVQVRDAYGNLNEKTVLAPIAPSRVDFKDNSTGENYIEFVSWPAYTSAVGAQFKQYDLYRSTDGGAFEKIGSSITTRGTNYRTDENLSAGATYTYKVAVTDTDDDVSLFSAPISDIPDGRGSSDALPPIISAVSAPVVQSLWAKIVWTTDEEADSVVEYGTSPTYGFTKTSDAMVKNHEVIVSDLTPNTSYFFKVTSKDGGNNSATDDNGAAGYLFTTPGGPIISGVSASSSDKTATISWTTDKDSDSHVFYSKNSTFNGYSEAIGSLIGGPTSTTYAHSLTLTDLDPGSIYYFYVQSTTAEGNASLDNNGGSYYTFRTSSDIYPPVISGIATPVRTSQSTVIFWKTNEPATSQVQYGNGTSSLNLSSDYDSTLSTYHSVTLDGLTANTTYQFNVISLDLAGNRGVSTTTAFTTTKEGEVKIVTVGGASAQTPAEAKDTTPPVISDMAVSTTTAFTATITFNTSEPAISSLQYGRDTDYGDIAGEKDYATRHTIRLSGLKMGTEYHFQVQTRDKVGNAAASADATFKTKFFSQANAGLKTIENLQQYEDEVEQSIESILPGILPPFVEEARVTDVTENSATVFWRTNVRSYGVVSFGTEEDFAKAANTSAAYTGEVSDTNAKTLEHTLQLIGLKPNTKYHFKVKSFSLPQVVGEGNDLTFVTKAPKVSASIIDIKNTSFRVIWSTDTPASTIVEYKNTKTGITERIIDEKPVAYHDILVERVVPGVSYEVRVFGYSASGALIESGTSLSVLTSRDVSAPKISNFKVDGALVPGRTDRVQTVVTWTTDEPSNSTVYYQEGAGQVTKDFANKAEQLDAYTTNHAIILSNLKPGTIYQMKIESVDTAGNKASFGPRTIITPQKGESIFDVIFKNFEDTFKFLRAAGQ